MADVESNASASINAELEAEMAAAEAAAPKAVLVRPRLPSVDDRDEGTRDPAGGDVSAHSSKRDRRATREVNVKGPKQHVSRAEKKRMKRKREEVERKADGEQPKNEAVDKTDEREVADDEDEEANGCNYINNKKKQRGEDKPKKEKSMFVEFLSELATLPAVVKFVEANAAKAALSGVKNFGVFLQAISNRDQNFYATLFTRHKKITRFILDKIVNAKHDAPLTAFALEFVIRAEDGGVKRSNWEPTDEGGTTEADEENGILIPLLSAKEMLQMINTRAAFAKHTRRVEIARSCVDLQRAASLFEKPTKFFATVGHASRNQLLARLVSKARRVDGALDDAVTVAAILDACDAAKRAGTPLGAKIPHFLKFITEKKLVPQGYDALVTGLADSVSKGQTTQAEQMTAVMLLKSALTAPDLADVLSPPVTENNAEDASAAALSTDDGDKEVATDADTTGMMKAVGRKYPRLTLSSPDVLSAVAVAVQKVRRTAEAPDAVLIAQLQDTIFTLLTHAAEEGAVLPRRAKAFVDEEARHRRAAEQAVTRPRIEADGDDGEEECERNEENEEALAIEAELVVESEKV